MFAPEILFRDRSFVVLNKPRGLAVHAGPRGGASVEDWFAQLSRRRTGPWLAHRLDADTAGCLVVALTKPALLQAQACFSDGRARKTYWAVVAGEPDSDTGTIAAPLLKVTGAAGWRMVVDEAGQAAVTDWQVLARGGGRSLLEIFPRSGRTHQVRVHCAALGCPIIGDPVYGPTKLPQAALQLLARDIMLPLSPVLTATAPVPPHMHEAVTQLHNRQA